MMIFYDSALWRFSVRRIGEKADYVERALGNIAPLLGSD